MGGRQGAPPHCRRHHLQSPPRPAHLRRRRLEGQAGVPRRELKVYCRLWRHGAREARSRLHAADADAVRGAVAGPWEGRLHSLFPKELILLHRCHRGGRSVHSGLCGAPPRRLVRLSAAAAVAAGRLIPAEARGDAGRRPLCAHGGGGGDRSGQCRRQETRRQEARRRAAREAAVASAGSAHSARWAPAGAAASQEALPACPRRGSGPRHRTQTPDETGSVSQCWPCEMLRARRAGARVRLGRRRRTERGAGTAERQGAAPLPSPGMAGRASGNHIFEGTARASTTERGRPEQRRAGQGRAGQGRVA